MFTAAGCWTDILMRYMEMGYFQLGQPSLSTMETDSSHNDTSPEEGRRPSSDSYARVNTNHVHPNHYPTTYHNHSNHANANHHSNDMRKRFSDGVSPVTIAIIPAT